MKVYVVRELWKYTGSSLADSEELICISANKDVIEAEIWSVFNHFYKWYWENEIGEESDHDKEIEESEREALSYELHRFRDYDEPLEYSHEWYPYCIKVDRMEVK